MTENQTTEPDFEGLRERYAALGQAQVFAFWDRLDGSERVRITTQASQLVEALPQLIEARERAVKALEAPAVQDLSPVDAVLLPESGGNADDHTAAAVEGKALLDQGRLAIFVVAGGQGTRLGFAGPKGAYPIGPVSQRCLFEIQAQKISGLSRRSRRTIPWYIMTSSATDAATRELFERRRYFGLSPESVFIFSQSTVPAFDFQGCLMLDRRDHIAENPDGHGGSLPGLLASGALDDMERRGIDTIFYCQVDNPLVQIGDPRFLGFHRAARAEMTCKVVRRVDPQEPVGVVVRVGDRLRIVEYTEIDDDQRKARDAGGELLYWAGSPAIHLFSTSFVRKMAENAAERLPYHASAKKIACVDPGGNAVEPTEANGTKLERFVFDALPWAERTCIVETSAQEEFSPIKNAEGPRSPATCRRDLVALYRGWLQAAGAILPPESRSIEIDHSRIDGPEEAAAAGLVDLRDAAEFIQISDGVNS